MKKENGGSTKMNIWSRYELNPSRKFPYLKLSTLPVELQPISESYAVLHPVTSRARNEGAAVEVEFQVTWYLRVELTQYKEQNGE